MFDEISGVSGMLALRGAYAKIPEIWKNDRTPWLRENHVHELVKLSYRISGTSGTLALQSVYANKPEIWENIINLGLGGEKHMQKCFDEISGTSGMLALRSAYAKTPEIWKNMNFSFLGKNMHGKFCTESRVL